MLGSTRRTRARVVLAAAVTLGVGVAATASGVPQSQAATKPRFSLVETLHPTSRAEAFKGATSRAAQSDPALLRSTSSKRVSVFIKLDYDSLATYSGQLAAFPATSPTITGHKLGSPAARAATSRYSQHITAMEHRVTRALRAAVPSAHVVRTLRTVYGGFVVTLPEQAAKLVARIPDVVAVQADVVHHTLVDESPEFIGAGTLYSQLGGDKNAGHGVIVGVLDTGMWPEHPSFTDDGSYPAPAPRPDGQPRVCNFGDNPLTPAVDVFHCDDKVVGGDIFYSAAPGSELYPSSARDSDGHGTHTASTAAGGIVTHVPLQGTDRGPIHGVAPGAAVAMYKVCGPGGCASSATTAAVEAAIDDGVNVINFSISGGTVPFQDPTELAFLDAYGAGVFVAASAGNEGPGAATANHLSPWVTTVAASTQQRAFEAGVRLASTDGATLTVRGASVMGGLAVATPVVTADSVAGYSGGDHCLDPAAPGTFTGKVVVCVRGTNGRVEKGYNVAHGNAAGMILINPVVEDVETDNHWLPVVHLDAPQGDQVTAFLAAHSGVTATMTAAQKVSGQGDVMAAFSSRGPAGNFIKPDITAPGVQILAGASPTPEPDDVTLGPPGNYFQAIAGTSMSGPHIAGAGALLAALHPTWTPGQIKSAIMTTAKQTVVKEDGVTPADPYDDGSGRVDLTKAGDPGLTIADTAADMAALAEDPKTSLDVNIASIDVPVMPGEVKTTRTVQNVTGGPLTFAAQTTAPAGASIRVTPATFTVAAGATRALTITISGANIAQGSYFGEIRFVQRNGTRSLHLPVAFVKTQSNVSLTTQCERDQITMRRGDITGCTVTATNQSLADTHVDLNTVASNPLQITKATNASLHNGTARASADLNGKAPGVPAIGPLGFNGFVELSDFGITPDPIGDETILNYNGFGNFDFAGDTYDTLGVVSNGYAVAGGGDVTDVNFVPQTLPDPSKPNNVLAPFWSDLDGTNAPGVYAGILSDNTTGDKWLVIEWQVQICCSSDTAVRTFQEWIGLNGVEDISYSYDPNNLPAAPPAGYGLTVGAENLDGSGGAMIGEATPTMDYRVNSTAGTPGGSYTYRVVVKGTGVGTGKVTSRMTTPSVRGTTIVSDDVAVLPPPPSSSNKQ